MAKGLEKSMNNKAKTKKPSDQPIIADYYLRSREKDGEVVSGPRTIENSQATMAGNDAHAKDDKVTEPDAVATQSGLRQMEDRLLAAITSMGNQMDSNMKELKSEFETRFSALDQTLAQNTQKVQDLEASVGLQTSRHSKCKQKKTAKEPRKG